MRIAEIVMFAKIFHVTPSSSQLKKKEKHASRASPCLLPASLALLCGIDFIHGGIAHVLAQVSPHSWRQRGDTIIPSSSISEATQKEARLRKSISAGARVGAIFKLALFFFLCQILIITLFQMLLLSRRPMRLAR